MFGYDPAVVLGFLLVLVGLVWSIIVVAGKRKAYGALVASGIGLILLVASGALFRMEGGFMVGLLAGLAGVGLSIFALVRGIANQAGQTAKLSATVVTGARCRSCGQPVPPDGNFCQHCGAAAHIAPATGTTAKCLVCGTEHVPGAKFCTACGQAL